jgi:hypothetical protein
MPRGMDLLLRCRSPAFQSHVPVRSLLPERFASSRHFTACFFGAPRSGRSLSRTDHPQHIILSRFCRGKFLSEKNIQLWHALVKPKNAHMSAPPGKTRAARRKITALCGLSRPAQRARSGNGICPRPPGAMRQPVHRDAECCIADIISPCPARVNRARGALSSPPRGYRRPAAACAAWRSAACRRHSPYPR